MVTTLISIKQGIDSYIFIKWNTMHSKKRIDCYNHKHGLFSMKNISCIIYVPYGFNYITF